jgi:hypothetical protein
MAGEISLCRRCLLKSTIPYLSFDDTGLCSACTDPRERLADQARQAAREPMQQLFEEARRSGAAYDVLVLVSGGGDSAYLLDLLVNQVRLKPLALFLAEAIGRPAASHNARRVAKTLGVDLMAFSTEAELVKRWIREGLPAALERDIGPHAGRDLFVYLRRTLSCNLAIKLGIPLVAEGILPYQGPELLVVQGEDRREYFCRSRKRRILRHVFREVFGSELRGSLYDPDFDGREDDLPNMAFPNAILDFSRPRARARLQEIGFHPKDFRGFDTNTDVNPFVSCFSYAAYDCHVNIEPMARQLRRRGYLQAGRRKLDREEALEFVSELKGATLFFAERERGVPDELSTYAELFPRLREIFGNDEIFLGRVRRKRKVRDLADYFGMALPRR